ncbi:FAD-binding oxidoreductase [Actinoplanes couchii]|uniref:Dehydrogenase n=1 Tax=Actinoplanes couchii TaxID=403638 RepID=A0ABQ3XEZ8_9ACTN|nr:FAD-binding oxidoreductase [Actinoplanes couchii]MDR6319937.1 alkyldihydroxyacetonephosphate synthase [Actinoplanes couchii]GID57073.1 dehydrogenase [Actinoplanes couchii]
MNRETMKWWGWGREDTAFHHDDKPALRPLLLDRLGVDIDIPAAGPPHLDDLHLPQPHRPEPLTSALAAATELGDVPVERLTHGTGKSLRELVDLRAGRIGRLPDLVVYPGDEDETAEVLRLAAEHGAVVIPFGGGSNISGSLRPPGDETRPVISLDLARMNRVESIDTESGLAVIQAGALGPELEDHLNAAGWTLGHFPDSFQHSTLGGWIATRSSGMQSDTYGDIAAMVAAVRVVTPRGLLVTRPLPGTSTGPSVLEMILGSEGRLGVITRATVRIRPLPKRRVVLGYLYPSWAAGLRAAAAITRGEARPAFVRLADAEETTFSLSLRTGGPGRTGKLLDAYVRTIRRQDPRQLCLGLVGYEGSPSSVRRDRKLVATSVQAEGGFAIGAGAGAVYDRKKFDTPYIRDFLLSRGVHADVSETGAPWSRLPGLYDEVMTAFRTGLAESGARGSVMCHLSHTDPIGACLYFTFAVVPAEDGDLSTYDIVKSSVQQAFVDGGGTLSHHHAVGTEHARWLPEDVSTAGAGLISALFTATDPVGLLNPGKIVP